MTSAPRLSCPSLNIHYTENCLLSTTYGLQGSLDCLMFVTTDRIVDADVDLLGQLNQGNIILNDLAGVLLVNDDLGQVEGLLLKDRLTLYEVVVVSNDNLASHL